MPADGEQSRVHEPGDDDGIGDEAADVMPSMCSTAARHPDEVPAWIGCTARVQTDSEAAYSGRITPRPKRDLRPFWSASLPCHRIVVR